jgi:DNA-binding PadR family transcriptional regulator
LPRLALDGPLIYRVYIAYTQRERPLLSIGMSLLAILESQPMYGLQLKNEFESRTGWVWPLNVGQVYTTLARLERDGLVEPQVGVGREGQKVYEITEAGRAHLASWFTLPMGRPAPSRDELVLKLVMALAVRTPDPVEVIQGERKAAMQLLQEYTRLKREAPSDADLGWTFLLDSLIFQTEARVRWLDACEARLVRGTSSDAREQPTAQIPPFGRSNVRSEVHR